MRPGTLSTTSVLILHCYPNEGFCGADVSPWCEYKSCGIRTETQVTPGKGAGIMAPPTGRERAGHKKINIS